jgi:hypothetical protein
MNEVNIARVVPMADLVKPIERLAILFDGQDYRLYRLVENAPVLAENCIGHAEKQN